MYIVFFDYEGTTHFFGYLQGKPTRFTNDIAKARRDLDELNLSRRKPLPGNSAARASFVEGFVRREIDIAEDGSVKGRNYFSESIIVEFRLGEPANHLLNQPSQEKSYFVVFALRFRGSFQTESNLELAKSAASSYQQFAAMDMATLQARAAAGDDPDFFAERRKITTN